MSKIQKILSPLLWIALLVGVARFLLSIMHAPRPVVYVASLTAVELLGMIYLAIKVGSEPTLGYANLWIANLILFGVCQLLTIAGLAYTYLSGTPTLYHDTKRLVAFLKFDPTPAQHIGMHVMNWMIIAPTIATWVIGAPSIYLVRKRSN